MMKGQVCSIMVIAHDVGLIEHFINSRHQFWYIDTNFSDIWIIRQRSGSEKMGMIIERNYIIICDVKSSFQDKEQSL